MVTVYVCLVTFAYFKGMRQPHSRALVLGKTNFLKTSPLLILQYINMSLNRMKYLGRPLLPPDHKKIKFKLRGDKSKNSYLQDMNTCGMFAISLITLKIKVFVVNVLFSCERWFVKMSHFYWNENINMIVKKFILSAKWMHLLERMSLKCKIKNSKRLSIFVFDGLVLMPVWSVDNFSCSTHCSIDEKFVFLNYFY